MSLVEAPRSRINYDDFDINPIQALIFELFRRSEQPNGESIVRMLLANRYSWFSIFPSISSGLLTLNDLVDNKFNVDGVTLYTDAEGVRKLNPLFSDQGACTISYLAIPHGDKSNGPPSPAESEMLKSLPNETRCYMFVGWPESDESKARFEATFR